MLVVVALLDIGVPVGAIVVAVGIRVVGAGALLGKPSGPINSSSYSLISNFQS